MNNYRTPLKTRPSQKEEPSLGHLKAVQANSEPLSPNGEIKAMIQDLTQAQNENATKITNEVKKGFGELTGQFTYLVQGQKDLTKEIIGVKVQLVKVIIALRAQGESLNRLVEVQKETNELLKTFMSPKVTRKHK